MSAIKALIISLSLTISCSTDVCNLASRVCDLESGSTRYILYDVNHQEGFNLRRDIYIRLARFVKHLNTRCDRQYYLVLPPWNNLPHWRSELAGSQKNLPWGLFFNIRSLKSYAPVIEAFEFFENHPGVVLDHVFVLQYYQDLWSENFTWVDKWNEEPCQRSLVYEMTENSAYSLMYGSYNVHAKNVQCISFQGPASLLEDLLSSYDGKNNFKSVLFGHAETILHDYFGDAEYWKCRRSMQFSDELKQIASNFKNSALLTSKAGEHSTLKSEYFEGDSYLCVHFRRRDYKYCRADHIPSVEYASSQIKEKLSAFNLSTVFIATDTDEAEFQKLSDLIQPFETVRYVPPFDIYRLYKDGGIAIIEQIICSNARYFLGSFESTFSFRIQEERELLNFNPNTTFNRLCGDKEENCKQPTRWLKIE